MLLKPAVSQEAALEWLKARVIETWNVEITPETEGNLKQMAESMARVSAIDLPEEIDPLFV